MGFTLHWLCNKCSRASIADILFVRRASVTCLVENPISVSWLTALGSTASFGSFLTSSVNGSYIDS